MGLGRMGSNLVLNLIEHGHEVIGFNRTPEVTKEFFKKEVKNKRFFVPAYSHKELVSNLKAPRVIWLMVSAGGAVDENINALVPFLDKGDIVIDGGNSNFKDSQRRAGELEKKGIYFLDVGTSGGISGARNGACLMIGGERKIVERLKGVFKDIAVKDGFSYIGPSGSGHFVKMVHNAIEYGIMQAIGEGFELIARGPYKGLDLADIARVWNHGSVIRGWLMELAQSALRKDPKLEKIEDYVEDSGEGRWSILTAIENNVPLDIAAFSLFNRFRSRQADSFSLKLLAALRNEFGGHKVKSKMRRNPKGFLATSARRM